MTRPLLLLCLLALAGCQNTSKPVSRIDLAPCRLDGVRGPVKCGKYTVWEDRASQAGRQIELNLAVVPAWGARTLPDPVFVLAGGPGQSATGSAAPIAMALRRVNEHREVVLVDQRGTGKSNPLKCDQPDGTLRDLLKTPDPEETRRCLDKLDGEPRFYTTDIAMDDLNEVRDALGYGEINLWGGSYGSRAALVFMRRHPQVTRRVVLDGAAPTDVKLVAYAGRDGQRALDILFDRCAANEGCAREFGDLRARFAEWLTTLDAEPQTVQVRHPRNGLLEDVQMTRLNVTAMIRSILYAPVTTALLPLALDRAMDGDFGPLVAEFGLVASGASDMAAGMYLSVVCAEDEPRITAEERETLTQNFLGPDLIRDQKKACAIWPAATMPESYFEPIVAEAPTLILSGDHDPVLPPSWGELTASRLPNAQHVVVDGAGHGLTAYPCISKAIHKFYDATQPEPLEVECADMSAPIVLDNSGRTQ